MVFGFKNRNAVEVKIVFSGSDIVKLKELTERLYNSIIPIEDIPRQVLSVIESAVAVSNSLNGKVAHSLKDEESVFGTFEKLFYVVSGFLSHCPRDEHSSIISSCLKELAETFDNIILRVLSQEINFINLLKITHRKTTSILAA